MLNSFVGRLSAFLLLLTLTVGSAAVGQSSESVEAERETPLYASMTFTIQIDESLYRNPFDQSDIELLGVFEAPSGRQVIIPGFWMQPYADECETPCLVDDLQPDGDPVWQVRYAPDEPGTWSYNLQVRDDGTTVKVENGQFDVTPSDHPGFIAVSPNDRYFQYSNGTTYFPIGHNLLWSWDAGGGLVAYRDWLRDLSAAGGNYARLLIDDPWFIGMEWNGPAGDYTRSQQAAARLDAIFDAAAENGISLQIIIQWQQALSTYQSPPVAIPDNPARPDSRADWSDYGYNRANGGTLVEPDEFYTDDNAKALFERRLRYIAARWGYSPQVFAWEIINQLDGDAGQVAWLDDMASYLRDVDQERHLITAGDSTSNALDFSEARYYQRRPLEMGSDPVVGSVNSIREKLRLASPVLLTEFSLNPWFEPSIDDPDGISVQTTLWASAFSGAAGGAMSAYGMTYVTPLGLQRYYPALAAYTSAVNWAGLELVPAEAILLNDDILYQSLKLGGFTHVYGAPTAPPMTHLITSDGAVPDLSELSGFMFGQVNNRAWHQPMRFHVAIPQETYFQARVRSTSTEAGARLVVRVDGKVAAELLLDAGAKNVAVRVPLSIGEHDIVLENMGDDWLELDSLEIGQFVAPVRMLTLRDSDAGVALSWLQNRDYAWNTLASPREPLLFTYRIDEMPVGKYTVEIWDPLSGAVIGSVNSSVGSSGILTVDLVPMSEELALRIARQPAIETPTPTPTGFTIVTNTPVLTESATATSTPTPTPSSTATRVPSATAVATEETTEEPTEVTTDEVVAATMPANSATPTATYTPTPTPTPN